MWKKSVIKGSVLVPAYVHESGWAIRKVGKNKWSTGMEVFRTLAEAKKFSEDFMAKTEARFAGKKPT